MANISDRRDISALWRQFLYTSAAVLPCAQCRGHFSNYLKNTIIVRQNNPQTMTGVLFRDSIKTQLRIFHNAVNVRIGKPIVPADMYPIVYPHRTRAENLFEIQKIVNELKAAWEPLLHSSIPPGVYAQWKHVFHALFSLLAGGPN